jgi:hypothetical protein
MDFMNAQNSYPVEYELVVNPEKAGPYPKGETWANPSIDHATALLKFVFQNRDDARSRGERARKELDAAYSEPAIAELIQKRLRVIGDRRRGPAFRTEMRAVYGKYEQLVSRIQETVDVHIPIDASVAVLSRGDERLVTLGSRQGSHFPQIDGGRYAGHHPASSSDAITHLEEIRTKGIEWLVIPETSFWWFDHYRAFADHLFARYELVEKREDVCAIVYLATQAQTGTSNTRAK